jgi:hypothetical protein
VSAQVYAVINPKRQRMVDFIAQRGGWALARTFD